MILTPDNFLYKTPLNSYSHRYQLIDAQLNNNGSDATITIDNLDNYSFKRIKNSNLSDIVCDLLIDLKNKNPGLRLWYSGGIDSHFILYHSIIANVKFDEIISVVKTPFDDPELLVLDEATHSAFTTLDENKEKLQSTKIIKTRLTHEHYENYFSEKDFWLHDSLHHLLSPTYTNNMINLFELDKSPLINIKGIDTPHIYWDHGWHFRFVDKLILPELVSKKNKLVYNTSVQCPEFVEAYVNAAVNIMEKFPDFQLRWSWDNIIKQSSKQIQRLIPEVSNINQHLWGMRLPKSVISNSDSADIKSKIINSNFRSYLYHPYAKKYKPSWFLRWENDTDWNWVEQSFCYPGIWSKAYKLND